MKYATLMTLAFFLQVIAKLLVVIHRTTPILLFLALAKYLIAG